MKKLNRRKHVFFMILLALIPIRIEIVQVRCESVEFKVNRVVWGDNIDNPIKAYPGDSEVPLTVEVQNLSSDKTIKGVSATLNLEPLH